MSSSRPSADEHAREVADGGHGGAKTLSERLPRCGAPEVVVATGSFGLGDDFEFAAVGHERGDRLERLRFGECRFPAIRGARAKVVQCSVEPAQVLFPGGGDDVDAAGYLVRSLHDACEAADDDVGDAVLVEGREHASRVELRRAA